MSVWAATRIDHASTLPAACRAQFELPHRAPPKLCRLYKRVKTTKTPTYGAVSATYTTVSTTKTTLTLEADTAAPGTWRLAADVPGINVASLAGDDGTVSLQATLIAEQAVTADTVEETEW